MKKITLLVLISLAFLGAQAQTTYQLNYDTIRVGKTTGTSGISLYGKVYFKNVTPGLVKLNADGKLISTTYVIGDITGLQDSLTNKITTANNGLTKTSQNIQFGGTLVKDTDLHLGSYKFKIDSGNTYIGRQVTDSIGNQTYPDSIGLNTQILVRNTFSGAIQNRGIWSNYGVIRSHSTGTGILDSSRVELTGQTLTFYSNEVAPRTPSRLSFAVTGTHRDRSQFDMGLDVVSGVPYPYWYMHQSGGYSTADYTGDIIAISPRDLYGRNYWKWGSSASRDLDRTTGLPTDSLPKFEWQIDTRNGFYFNGGLLGSTIGGIPHTTSGGVIGINGVGDSTFYALKARNSQTGKWYPLLWGKENSAGAETGLSFGFEQNYGGANPDGFAIRNFNTNRNMMTFKNRMTTVLDSVTLPAYAKYGTGTGFVKATSGMLSYDNTAYAALTGATFTGSVLLNSDNIYVIPNRSSSSFDASVVFRTAGVNKWQTGLIAGSTSYVVKNSTTGTNAIAINESTNELSTIGNIVAPSIKLTTGANNGYVLRSDASGNATWQSDAAGMTYKGSWNASTNTPTLADGVGTNGDMYAVSVSGTQFSRSFVAGGFAIYNGSIWESIGTSSSVGSVNSLTGAVQINPTLSGTTIGVTGGTTTIDIGSISTSGNAATATTLQTSGSGADGRVSYNAAYGVLMQGKAGSIADNAIFTPAGSEVFTNATGTQNAKFWGALQAVGAITGSNLSGTNTGDQNLAPYATLASPVLTGIPTAPTATAGTNTAQLATTAFVQSVVTATGASSGTYTPDLTNIQNIDASSLVSSASYMKIGNIITVSFQVNIDPATATPAILYFSLPTAWTSSGTASSGTVTSNGVGYGTTQYQSSTQGQATLTPTLTSSQIFTVTYTYSL